MTITSRDQIIAALGNNNSRLVIDKASIANTAAGQVFSLWRAVGVPGQGAIPSAATVCTSALIGAFGFTNQTSPATSYIAWLFAMSSNNASNIEIHDRLAHMGGLSGIVATAQGALTLAGVPAARLGDASFLDCQWWLEWYADTGATAVTFTVNVTYDDNSTGNLVGLAPGGTVRAGRMLPLVSAVAGRYIKAVNSVTLSATTGTAGSFGITASRPCTVLSFPLANKIEQADWAMLGLPEVPNDACPFMLMTCSTTTTGTLRGGGKIAHG